MDDDSSRSTRPNGTSAQRGRSWKGFWRSLRRRGNGEATVRDTLEELIEDFDEDEAPVEPMERVLLANVLSLRDLTVVDVMVPRADIIAVDAAVGIDELIEKFKTENHSRLPVYRDSLDDCIGMVHIRDVLGQRFGEDARDLQFRLSDLVRPVLFVAPSMRVLDLLLEMRVKRTHMALVVDEYGGIDGLLTIEDLVEEIVGEIQDEHDDEPEPQMVERPDGAVLADARVELEEFEDRFGEIFTEEEKEDSDTLGGLVFSLAGRVPVRGELVKHDSGLIFEVVDGDPRRVRRLRIRNLDTLNLPESANED
ncbi:MAG: hemolysin family protein [Rhodospirillales bacterium]